MTSYRERQIVRALHLVLSVPIVGMIYGPVARIPPAAWFTRFIAVPVVILSGIWLWQKPRLLRWCRGLHVLQIHQSIKPVARIGLSSGGRGHEVSKK